MVPAYYLACLAVIGINNERHCLLARVFQLDVHQWCEQSSPDKPNKLYDDFHVLRSRIMSLATKLISGASVEKAP